MFRCYLIFVLTCNFFSRWQFLLLHTEKTHDTKCNNRFCPPISRRNRKSFWTAVNSERFRVSNIFNESSDCVQVQGLQITILWKTKVVLLFHCESSHACQPLAPLSTSKTSVNAFAQAVNFKIDEFLASRLTNAGEDGVAILDPSRSIHYSSNHICYFDVDRFLSKSLRLSLASFSPHHNS